MHRFIYSVLTISLLISSSISYGQEPTSISGHAPDFAGETISLLGYVDFITNRTELLDQTLIDNSGEFTLEWDQSEIRYIQLSCDFTVAHLYTQQGGSYDLEFPLPASDVPRTFGKKAKTEVIFNNLDIDDINANIIDFNYNYEIFFRSNYELLKRIFSPQNANSESDSTLIRGTMSPAHELFSKTDEFALIMDSIYSDSDSEYFKIYRSSVIGDLSMNGPASRREIFDRFIKPFSFKIQHPEHTKLYQRFFKYYFATYGQLYGDNALNQAINEEASLSKLSQLLEVDDFLSDNELMEVVIGMSLKEIWDSPILDQSKAIEVLDSIAHSPAHIQSSRLAQSLIIHLSSCASGFPLYSFEFEDQFNEKRSISQLDKKPTLIQFWASWCSSCELEMDLLEQLAVQYEKNIQILDIQVLSPSEVPDYKDLPKNYIQTSLELNTAAIRELEILSVPYYILLDANGHVINENAPKPGDELEAIFHSLKTKGERRSGRRVGSKDN